MFTELFDLLRHFFKNLNKIVRVVNKIYSKPYKTPIKINNYRLYLENYKNFFRR